MSNIIKFDDHKQELDHFKQLATIAAKSGTTTMAPETILNIMLTAKDLGISPFKALNGGFYVVNGKISMSTAMMTDRIRKEGHSIKIPEWTSQKCIMIGIRKDNGDSIKFEYTMDDAVLAGLTSSPTWKKFPKQMLYNRAMSTLARTLFPDVVGNAYSEDERWDIEGVAPEKRPLQDPDLTDTITLENVSMKNSALEKVELEINIDRREELKDHILEAGHSIENLDGFLSACASKSNCSEEKVIDHAFLPKMLDKFISAYSKHLDQLSA